jgi:hypothetical protein
MRLDLRGAEADLLKFLLVKELEMTRVELHHSSDPEFRARMEQRESALWSLIARFRNPEK